jgi:hypothetical protein
VNYTKLVACLSNNNNIIIKPSTMNNYTCREQKRTTVITSENSIQPLEKFHNIIARYVDLDMLYTTGLRVPITLLATLIII